MTDRVARWTFRTISPYTSMIIALCSSSSCSSADAPDDRSSVFGDAPSTSAEDNDPAATELASSGPVAGSDAVTGNGSVDGVQSPSGAPSSAADDMTATLLVVPEESPSAPPTPEEEACASARVESEVTPVTLFLALDVSGSMVSQDARAFRWDPITAALNSFADDPASVGLNMALKVFPHQTATGSFDARNQCNPDTYMSSDIQAGPLPAGPRVSSYLQRVKPAGGTPTVPALKGVIEQANQVLEDPKARAAILLLSDGTPSSCTQSAPKNNVDGASEVVASVADRIPTYVIGVGDRLDDLNQVAQAGGTTDALIVSPQNPEQTRTLIFERLEAIRGELASCDVPIPAAPPGQTLAAGRVSAEVIAADGRKLELEFDQECTTPLGFHYDSLDKPTTVHLCTNACQELQQDGAKIDVLFGCFFEPPSVR